jgi:protease-4
MVVEIFTGKASQPVFSDFLQDFLLVMETPGIKKISFIVNHIEFGFAELNEICYLVNQCKSKNIITAGHSTSGDLKTLYFLAHLDQRYCYPNAEFYVTLPSVESFFFKKLLKNWGIEVENYASGKYKSFAEMFTRENFSKEAKENLNLLITSLQSQVANVLEKTLAIDLKNEVSPILTADRLVKIGFFKDVLEEEDFQENLEYEDYRKPEDSKSTQSDYEEISIGSIYFLSSKRDFSFFSKKKRKLAIIPLKGDIVEGEREEQELKEGVISAYPTIQLLKKLREDKMIGAVILEIDSGGGSAFASDLIYREILKLKKEKKVYSYFQNISASGGYYIAAATQKIISNPFCITGSIGTVMVRPDFKGFYDKIGITKDRIGFYKGREIFSEYGKLSRESKQFMIQEIQRVKSLFYKVVSENRKISLEDLEKVAGGRVFSGKDFLELKMVDSNDSLLQVIEEIKKEAGIQSKFWEYYTVNYSMKAALKEWSSLQSFIRDPITAIFKQNRFGKLEMISTIAKTVSNAWNGTRL